MSSSEIRARGLFLAVNFFSSQRPSTLSSVWKPYVSPSFLPHIPLLCCGKKLFIYVWEVSVTAMKWLVLNSTSFSEFLEGRSRLARLYFQLQTSCCPTLIICFCRLWVRLKFLQDDTFSHAKHLHVSEAQKRKEEEEDIRNQVENLNCDLQTNTVMARIIPRQD